MITINLTESQADNLMEFFEFSFIPSVRQDECIDVMLETQGKEAVLNFCLCNAFKYLYRHNRKNGIEDVKKAKWYVDKYIELVGDDK